LTPFSDGLSFLTHLECSKCGGVFDAGRVQTVCPRCDKPLLARYDLEKATSILDRGMLRWRSSTLWRYLELLPVGDRRFITSLGEGWTPLLRARRLGEELGLRSLWIKDESLNPTGTFKARGLSVAVSKALELGVRRVAMPSAGNAAAALAAYGARAGLEVHVYMPRDAPRVNIVEAEALGAEVTLVRGLITDAARLVGERARREGWMVISTLREPYRLEGKKTMGYELAEQMGWRLPDVVIYPTGGGTGLIGMWKGFQELEALGWIDERRPRMVSVQAAGCAPIVKAFKEGREEAEPWPGAQTIASGLRVPKALGDFLILRVLRESGGTAIAVDDKEILEAMREMARLEGVFPCPEGAATLAALRHLIDEGWVDADERVILFNTGTGLKYTHLLGIQASEIEG
jgi:threonine synthase